MHSRLPLFAGVPGKSAAAALTAALLITGCTPNPFGPPGTANLEHLSAAQELPAAVGQTAESTVADVATGISERIREARPEAELGPAASGISEAEPEPQPGRSTEDTGAGGRLGLERHRDELQDWSDSVKSAYQTAQEQDRLEAEEQQRQAEEAAEAERQAEEEAAEAQRQAEEEAAEQEDLPETDDDEPLLDLEAGQDADQGPEDSHLSDSLSPPAVPDAPSVEFTGDLSDYLQSLADAHPGETSISLQEITGQQRSAAASGSATRVTASTYKLYVAYSIIRQVESGTLRWTDSVTGGRDVADCLQDMIAVSDNPCPEATGPEIGWTAIYSDAAAAGATSTGQGDGAIVTTADDLTSLLAQLETGQLNMSEAGHEMLRSALGDNVHRFGVPAGSAGQVLNKPGWIDGYIHDAAIVRHPQGTYVLSIMSEGSSWDSLASITRDVESALYG